MASELHQTQVDLDGLLEVLGRNLYSTPAVAIRELIQNAHDACVRSRLETGRDGDFSIRIQADSHRNQIVITDNGSGLTYEEVLKYLATIGSGYTRVLRDSSHNEDMVGYFGLGFLSAYVVAEKVEVWTTSYQTPEQTWYFSTAGGKKFAISATAPAQVGTTVKLHLREEFYHLAESDLLQGLIERYCCLLRVPIFLNNDDVQVNNLVAPWRLDAATSELQRKKRRLEFAAIFEGAFEPLCAIPIPENNPWSLKGLLWVQDRGGYATSDYRNISVFVRSMFITGECRELLPLWAGFAGGVVESVALSPTASREDIQKNERFYEIRDFLAETLIEGLRTIAANESSVWRRILSRHNQTLLGAALSDDRLFEVMQNDLKIPTTIGDVTLPAYLKQSGGVIYIRNEDKNSQEELLFRAQMKPLVSGYLYAASGFCQKYAHWNHLKAHILGSGDGETKLFTEETVDKAIHDKLAALLLRKNEALSCARFEPAHVPLLVIHDQDVALKKRIERDEADKRIGSAALSLARLHTQAISAEIERRLYVNLNSPLIAAMIDGTQEAAGHLAVAVRAYMESLTHQVDDSDSNFSDELKRFSDALLAITKGE
ncbi:Molecular chaperone, HSP90 family [Hahella chejuensis KCTC 2396]|uniref:Molecular chaperone, HSP90 family n=1 Tax=Hahella chejuensis (strain KCTC 2396) TaxID=349521 RepID=Q2SLM3_HAHCH|nr:ATP-binding protein [Hahella chejuensis]ABC28451.1 Molecular chaperone, HSP90 family [Hahella chejuensis KCTC 2396]